MMRNLHGENEGTLQSPDQDHAHVHIHIVHVHIPHVAHILHIHFGYRESFL